MFCCSSSAWTCLPICSDCSSGMRVLATAVSVLTLCSVVQATASADRRASAGTPVKTSRLIDPSVTRTPTLRTLAQEVPGRHGRAAQRSGFSPGHVTFEPRERALHGLELVGPLAEPVLFPREEHVRDGNPF